MQFKRAILKTIAGLGLLFLLAPQARGQIPVVDMDAIRKVISDLQDILVHYQKEIKVYKDIFQVKNEYLNTMRQILYRAESLFNAVTYFPKTVPGQYKLNPFFYDLTEKNTWGDLYHSDGQLQDRFPELIDFEYITKTRLYKIDPAFRDYADRVIAMMREETVEVENEFSFVRMIREFQKKEAELLDKFRDVIVPAFGSPDKECEEKKVVDVTRLYYSVAAVKIEVLKQKLELLMMEKETMENYLKGAVNGIKHRALVNSYRLPLGK